MLCVEGAEYLLAQFASTSSGDLSPMCSIIGSMAAQEALKAASGKFAPISQWFYFDRCATVLSLVVRKQC